MQLDAGRLKDLQVFSAAELKEIGRGTIRSIASQLDALDRALAEADLEAMAEVAHRARNETQLVGARELEQELGTVEEAARARRENDARQATAAARSLWRATREAIERATQGETG